MSSTSIPDHRATFRVDTPERVPEAQPVRSANEPRTMELGVPSVLQCSFLILFTKVSLRALGFGRTIKWIRKRVQLISENLPVDLEHIKAVEYSVAMAGALYPGRALCLEQSLVLYYLLKRQGVDVQYHHGVQFHPFRAHAWVEYRNMPINDVVEHLKLYVRLSAVLP